MTGNPPPCPLCDDDSPTRYHRDRTRDYWKCLTCSLVFVPPKAHLDPVAEKTRYDQHDNDPADPRYRAFLGRLAEPLLERVPAGSVGLDFGSGPGPTLGPMLELAGLKVHLYDPYYAPDLNVWHRRYDFITATEVFEHLRHPRVVLDHCFAALSPGGYLAIMTKWVDDRDVFTRSRYIRDPTHVCFFSAVTCRWIARRWRVALEIPETDVALFRRTGPTLSSPPSPDPAEAAPTDGSSPSG